MIILNTGAHLQADLLASLKVLQHQGQEFWSSFTPEAFVTKVDPTWSPAENVVHLVKSIRPVARALRLPRWLLRLLFGLARAPSRRWEPLREAYLQRLATGVEAGSYGPTPRRYDDPTRAQQDLAQKLDDALQQLHHALERWTDTDLERYQLPHPSLGKLTVREMVIFSLFHYLHHVEKVQAKRKLSMQ